MSILFCLYSFATNAQYVITPPAGNLPTRIVKNGQTIIPNGRIVEPAGKQVMVAPHPYGLIISPDGNTLVTANSGTSPLSVSIIRDIHADNPTVQQIPPGPATQNGVLASVFMGLAINPANSTVYVAGGQQNRIYKFSLINGEAQGYIDCAVKTDSNDYTHGYIGDMMLSRDGKRLYAVDQIGFRMVIVDVENEKLLYSIPVGRYPFGIALSPNEKKVYVANVGMYEYKLINSLDPKNLAGTALPFPAFDYLSKETCSDFKNDSVNIPALGDPYAPEAFSVWTIDLAASRKPAVTAKVKTGIRIGELINGVPAVGGSSPNSIVASDQYIFVSNGNNDCISVIDAQTNVLLNNIPLSPEPRLKNLRGVIPFGLALSADKKRLFAAEAGINAVAVIDINSMTVTGHIPAGWFPAKITVSNDGKEMYVANAKGYGSGPNGGKDFVPGPEGSNIGRLMKGTISIIGIPDDALLKKYTQQVIDNNFRFEPVNSKSFQSRQRNPIPLFPKQRSSPIKHWVFIPKENRTYDEVLGQLSYANGDSTIARFGRNVPMVTNTKKTNTVTNVTIAHNHLSLAERFAIGDNFYVDADHSADGHRWLVGTYPNEWVETSTSASYGGNRSMRANSGAPGNLSMVGSSSAIYPEDYNEAGSIWDHFERNNIDYFNFGLGLGLAARLNDQDFKPLGVKYMVNYPMPAKLIEHSSRLFPVYNTAIPDQFRADMFIKEVEERWRKPGKPLPAVITARIPNDHGAEERPEDGYPFRESYMADNDLAIGRVVEYLSRTPYWKNMAIVITEDDSQGGVDHVDAHRSILMVISPYAKKRYAGKVHYSFGSIFKTLWNSLGIPYLNQYDAGAADMADLFTDKPDFTPYNAIAVDSLIFDPQKALTPIDEKFNWKALESNSDMDHPKQMLKDSEELDKKIKEQKKGRRTN